MITAQQIQDLLKNGESVKLECKKAGDMLPHSIWETYSAFANTYGGTILLGITEHSNASESEPRFTISGVSDAKRLCKDLWNILNNRDKVSLDLLRDEDVQIVNLEGKDVIVITVPAADYSDRPVYINHDLLKGVYRRKYEGDYRCSDEEIKMMLRDANPQGNDSLFIKNYTMDDIDIPTLERYRMMFKISNPEHVWNELAHKDFLRQLGGYTVDRETRQEGLTMAGLLMFGKGLSIRDRFDNLRMDYIDRSDLIGDQRYNDRITYDGTWENNLFNFMRMVLPRIVRDLPRPFQMQGLVREDDTLQHKAVREAFTNCIIHADLLVNGVLKVEKFKDRLVMTNPGHLKLPIDRIYHGGESQARNLRMQNMFRMIGYGENIGSGFPLILKAWQEKQWPKPELVDDPDILQVKMTLKIPENVQKESKNVQKESRNVLKELSERQKNILNIIISNQSVRLFELSKLLNFNERTIRRELTTLIDLGYIKKAGSRKNGHWEILI
jgi:predicted HTH transcriptional regulator